MLKLNTKADNNFSDASSPLELQIGNAVTVETATVQHHTVVVTLEENTEGITQTIDDDNTLGDGVKVMQVHDEMVLETPSTEVDTLIPLLRTAMADAYPLDVPLDVEVKVGPNWRDVTPHFEELPLQEIAD